MITALLVFLGLSGACTVTIVASVALAARRPIPCEETSAEQVVFTTTASQQAITRPSAGLASA